MRCKHGYGHHEGMHACDPYNHGDMCPVTSFASQLLGVPFLGVREERLEHDHIGQKDNGVAGCPACESIDPYRMTMGYAREAEFAARYGGWG